MPPDYICQDCGIPYTRYPAPRTCPACGGRIVETGGV